MWVSQEAAFRSTDDWKDTTVIKEALTCGAVLGLDVGKFSHWACCVTRAGEVVASSMRAPNERPDSSQIRSSCSLSGPHGSPGSPLLAQLQKPDLDTPSSLAITSTG